MWRWRHRDTNFELSPLDGGLPPRGQLDHELREAWRATCWDGFLRGHRRRRDAAALAGTRCDGLRFKAARLAVASAVPVARSHLLAAFTGATVSPARLAANLRATAARAGVESEGDGVHEATCTLCQRAVGTRYHLWWECDAISRADVGPPADLLQEWMGWPRAAGQDAPLLRVLADVRARVLQERMAA